MEENLNLQTVETCENQPMNFFTKLLKIFLSPEEVLEDIMNQSKMLLPLVYCSILAIITYFIRLPLNEITMKKLNDAYMQYGIPFEQTEVSSSLKILSGFLAPINIIISWLIGGCILWIFVKLFKGKSDIKQILSLYAHIYMISFTGVLIAAPINLILYTDIVIFSPAVFMPNGSITSLMYVLLSRFEVFTIWSMIIAGFGISMFNNFSKTKGMIVISLYFLLGTVLITLSSVLPFMMMKNLI